MDNARDNTIRNLAGKLSQLLQANGGIRYDLHYTGSGDSTDGCDVNIEPENLSNVFDELQVEYETEQSTWVGGKTVSGLRVQSNSFEDAAYDLAQELWLRAGQGGWYNNEGGYGDLAILPGGFIEFRHVNYLNDADDDDQHEEEEACHWRFNILVGPIDEPYNDGDPPATTA